MLLFLAVAATLWGIGWMMGAPRQARALMLGLWYVVTLMLLLLLPPEAALHRALGGSVALWLILGGFGALVTGYIYGLRYLRRFVRPENRTEPDWEPKAPEPDPDAPLSDRELERYTRQILLRELGGAGQRRLKSARVLVVGAGGLGAPVLHYLAGAGVGTIGVIDADVVDLSNLHRQVIHREGWLGKPKVFSAQAALGDLNRDVLVRPYHRRLDEEIAGDLLAEYDLVIDGSDNFETRYLVNRACVAAQLPLVSGAITQWEGQVSLFAPAQGAPCYQCVFPEAPAPELAPSCAEAGVIGPLPGVVGAMMALEAVKHLAGAGATLAGEMLVFDGLYGESRKLRLKPRRDCPVCGGGKE